MTDAQKAATDWKVDPSNKNVYAVLEALEPLCRHWAHKRLKYIKAAVVSFDDLMQEARIGVMQALPKWDGASSFKMYATFYIRAYTLAAAYSNSSAITYRMSGPRAKLLSKFGKTYYQVTQDYPGISDTEAYEKIAQILEVPVTYVHLIVEEKMPTYSIDFIPAGSNQKFVDHEACDCSPPDERAAAAELIERMLTTAESLRDDLRMHTAMLNILKDEPLTNRQMGKKFGCTKQRMHQFSKEARSILGEFICE